MRFPYDNQQRRGSVNRHKALRFGQKQAAALDPLLMREQNFADAARHCCRTAGSGPEQLTLGIRDHRVELMVFDLDDTLAKLYAPVARLNWKYLKQIAQDNDVGLHQVAKRVTTLANLNPDAVVHDPRQMVRTVFGHHIAETPATQNLISQWQRDKRAAFTAGVDAGFGPAAAYFKQGGAQLAILSNSPQTPLRERLFLIEAVLQKQGQSLLALIDIVACKPDPEGLTPQNRDSMGKAERQFQTALDKSGKLLPLPARMRKDAGIGLIKETLQKQRRLQQPITKVVQVGDRPSDLTTAHRAGAQAVWIARNLLTTETRLTMHMVGERKVAETAADMMPSILGRHGVETRPHAIIGSIERVTRLFTPLAPR